MAGGLSPAREIALASPAPCPAAERPEAGLPGLARPQLLASETLFQGRRLVEIAHNGEVYRLQATKLGKLILTK